MFVKRYGWNTEVKKPTPENLRSKLYSVNTDMVENPRWSESMGVTPEQIPEAMRTFPGSEYDSEGRLLITSRKHKKFEMKRRGYTEIG